MFLFSKKNPEKELEYLKKAYEILEERYKKKTISLEEFTKQCSELKKKKEKYQKMLNK